MKKLFRAGLSWVNKKIALTRDEVASDSPSPADVRTEEPAAVVEAPSVRQTQPSTMSETEPIAKAQPVAKPEPVAKAQPPPAKPDEPALIPQPIVKPASVIGREPTKAESVVSPVAQPQAPAASRVPVKEEPLEPAVNVKVMKRGPNFYGVCPHCECTWNIGERITDPRFQNALTLTQTRMECPGCKKPLALPSPDDIRKIG